MNGTELDRKFLAEVAGTEGELIRQIRLERTRKHDTRVNQVMKEIMKPLERDRRTAIDLRKTIPAAPNGAS